MRLAATALLLCAFGCGGSTAAPAPAADFLLPDVNATSPTFSTSVSPRDERGRLSAWYFGSAT